MFFHSSTQCPLSDWVNSSCSFEIEYRSRKYFVRTDSGFSSFAIDFQRFLGSSPHLCTLLDLVQVLLSFQCSSLSSPDFSTEPVQFGSFEVPTCFLLSQQKCFELHFCHGHPLRFHSSVSLRSFHKQRCHLVPVRPVCQSCCSRVVPRVVWHQTTQVYSICTVYLIFCFNERNANTAL